LSKFSKSNEFSCIAPEAEADFRKIWSKPKVIVGSVDSDTAKSNSPADMMTNTTTFGPS